MSERNTIVVAVGQDALSMALWRGLGTRRDDLDVHLAKSDAAMTMLLAHARPAVVVLEVADTSDESLARLRRGLSEWRATSSITYETYYLALLAEALAKQQQFDESQRLLDQSLVLANRTGEGFWTAELLRLRGETRLASSRARDRAKRAETDFRQALDVARRHGAKALEQRAADSLAQLVR